MGDIMIDSADIISVNNGGNLFSVVPIFELAIMLITIIVAIKRNYKKGVIEAIACFVAAYIVYYMGMIGARSDGGLLDDSNYESSIAMISTFSLISIIIQLIPFIICLKNNKKVKKDEVKQ